MTLPPSRQILLQTLGKRADLSAGIVSGTPHHRSARARPAARRPCSSRACTAWRLRGPDLRFVHNAVVARGPGVSILAKDLRRAVKPLPGVFVEDKTLFGGAAHARRLEADRLHATTRFNALAEPFLSEGTLRLQPGDHMLELLPNVDWAKGDAVRAIMRHVEADTQGDRLAGLHRRRYDR